MFQRQQKVKDPTLRELLLLVVKAFTTDPMRDPILLDKAPSTDRMKVNDKLERFKKAGKSLQKDGIIDDVDQFLFFRHSSMYFEVRFIPKGFSVEKLPPFQRYKAKMHLLERESHRLSHELRVHEGKVPDYLLPRRVNGIYVKKRDDV